MLRLATSKMLRPFDHVTLCDMELVLLYRNHEKTLFGENGPEWYAKDPYGNKIGVMGTNLYKLPVQAYNENTPMEEPAFFRERGNKLIRVKDDRMLKEVYNNCTSGKVIINNVLWDWNTHNLTIKNQDETWLLRVFTMGGWWL